MLPIYYIGLDIDKASFKACLKLREVENPRSVIKATRSFANCFQGFQEFNQWVKRNCKPPKIQLKIIMEATGVYHEHLAWYLYQLDYSVFIILPLRAKRYFQSLGHKTKNDRVDALGLADLGLHQELKLWQPCSKNILLLRSLTRQLQMFQETRTSLRNQLEAATHQVFCDPTTLKNLKFLITNIEKSIRQIKERISEFILNDPALSKKYRLMELIKGLGIITFATLVAETGGFESFESQKQLVSYAGYDVIENQSGKHTGKTRISKKGNSHIRRILHLVAFNMVRYEVHVFDHLYDRIHDRTKIKMKAYVAIQRKLLCLIYALWKSDSIFDPNYQSKINSGIHEPKSLFSVGPIGPDKEVATEVNRGYAR